VAHLTLPPGTPNAEPPEQPAQPAPGSGRSRRATPYLLLLPGMAWLVIFFGLPLAFILATSLYVPAPSGAVGEYLPAFRVANYTEALVEYRPQFIRSFLYASIATALAFGIGYPLAYMIAFKSGRWRNLLLVLVVAPFFTSFLLRTMAWRQILADEGFVVPILKALNIIPDGLALTASPIAVVAGLTYNFLPFMVLPLYASIERIDPRMIEAGADLYGSAFTVLRKVTLPLSLPGIVSGTLLTFIPAAGDYVNAQLLGNRSTTMLGNVIDSRFFRVVDYPAASALSFMLMATILLLVFLYIRRAGTEELV
jgi:spermidine/putrescine transport system permease protein